MGYNYLTKEEAEMEPKLVDAQIVLGLQTCKTKKDVFNLLEDVRLHERDQIKNYVKSYMDELEKMPANTLGKMTRKNGRLPVLRNLYNVLLRREYYGR